MAALGTMLFAHQEQRAGDSTHDWTKERARRHKVRRRGDPAVQLRQSRAHQPMSTAHTRYDRIAAGPSKAATQRRQPEDAPIHMPLNEEKTSTLTQSLV